MMSTTDHVNRGLGLLACAGLLLAITAGSACAQQEEGASGAVRGGMDSAADSTKRGLTRAGEAVGGAIDTAITKTGRGISRALESTGNGIQRAGRAISGGPEPTPHEEIATEPAAAPEQPVPEHPIQEEPLN